MSTTKSYKWHKIADSIASIKTAENGLTEIQVAGKPICVSVQADTVLACAAKCPHASGSMVNGYVDALGQIVCPLHRYKFMLQNGRCTSGEGYYLKTYPIKQDKTGIFVGIEDGNWLSWLK